jgi:hypothetical protein
LSRHGYPSDRVQARSSEPAPAVGGAAHRAQGLVSLPALSIRWLWGPSAPRLSPHERRLSVPSEPEHVPAVGGSAHRAKGSFSLTLLNGFFSRVGWGVGQRDQSTASYWGLATPWQRHQPTSLPPFFSWLCVFTPDSFSGFRNTYGPGPQGPQPACSLGLWGV